MDSRFKGSGTLYFRINMASVSMETGGGRGFDPMREGELESIKLVF